MKAVIVVDEFVNITNISKSDTFFIGVERGCLNLINNSIKIDISIGDFDSVNEKETNLITKNSKKLIKLSSSKDYSDTFEAVKIAYDNFNDVVIYGGIQGNRIEHFIANLSLFKKYPMLKLIDDNSFIYSTKKDLVVDKNGYTYISFFAIENIKELNLKDFKYELKDYNLNCYDPICLSNEILETGKISFFEGHLLIIQSK